jgi:hypothetical protein
VSRIHVLGAAVPTARGFAQSSMPQRVAGCYVVNFGPWTPDLPIGRDSVFMYPPSRIQLHADTGTTLWEQGQWLVRPAPGVPRSVHRFSFFRVSEPDTIEVLWSTGFSGLRMRLDADALTGHAASFWDFPRQQQVAAVRLERTNCE